MHIVYLTNEYPSKISNGGGIGSFVKFLASKLSQNNIRVSVIGISNSKNNNFFKDDNVTIYNLKKSSWKFGKFYDNTKRILQIISNIDKEQKVSIVEGSELNFAFFPKKTTYKKIIRLHGGHHFFARELGENPALWRGYQEKKSFKKADAFIAVTNYVGAQTKKYLNVDINYTTIYNSIELDKFYKSDKGKEVSNTLLFIGTVCEKKGVEQLILAFKILKKDFLDLKLTIVGRDWLTKKGSYIEYLKHKYKEIIKEGIVFTEYVPYNEIPSLIASSKVCVYPSIAESFGLTIIEAMAMGKAIAVSNIKPFKEIVNDSDSALFFNPNKPVEIAEKIKKILENDNLRDILQFKSREHIFSMFDTSKITKQNLEFYKSIVK